MNKNDLIKKVARVTCAKKEAAHAVNEFISAIKQALQKNEKITISGLGTFLTKTRKARNGINPQTGQLIQINEKTAVKFKPSKNILT